MVWVNNKPTFAGVNELENRDTLTNDQLSDQANETP